MLFRSTSCAAAVAAVALTFGASPEAQPEAIVTDPMLAALTPSFCLMDQRGRHAAGVQGIRSP